MGLKISEQNHKPGKKKNKSVLPHGNKNYLVDFNYTQNKYAKP